MSSVKWDSTKNILVRSEVCPSKSALRKDATVKNHEWAVHSDSQGKGQGECTALCCQPSSIQKVSALTITCRHLQPLA